jgi:hypothetical protein
MLKEHQVIIRRALSCWKMQRFFLFFDILGKLDYEEMYFTDFFKDRDD